MREPGPDAPPIACDLYDFLTILAVPNGLFVSLDGLVQAGTFSLFRVYGRHASLLYNVY